MATHTVSNSQNPFLDLDSPNRTPRNTPQKVETKAHPLPSQGPIMSTAKKVLMALFIIATAALIVGTALGINGMVVSSYGHCSTAIPFLLTSVVLGTTGFLVSAYQERGKLNETQSKLNDSNDKLARRV